MKVLYYTGLLYTPSTLKVPPSPPGRLNEGRRHSYDGPRAAKGG